MQFALWAEHLEAVAKTQTTANAKTQTTSRSTFKNREMDGLFSIELINAITSSAIVVRAFANREACCDTFASVTSRKRLRVELAHAMGQAERLRGGAAQAENFVILRELVA